MAENIVDRFWKNVKKGTPDECWEWQGSRIPNGYGRFFVLNQAEFAHRIAYEFAVGHVTKGMHVCHTCDNPPCCNPAHLWVGTAKDNMQDRERKGRGVRGRKFPGKAKGSHIAPAWMSRQNGESNQNAKLTADKVREARQLHQQGQITIKALAHRYGVDSSTMCSVINRQTWREIE